MTTAPPVRLAGRTLKETRHICAFFHSKEEQNKVLMPFFKEGFERGEKLFHVVDGRQRDEHLCACQDGGIDVETCATTEQLEVRTWEEAYLQDGYFDGDRMIRILTEVLESNRAKYKLMRLMGNMEWALETVPGVTDIVEYETKLNFLPPKYPIPSCASTISIGTAAASSWTFCARTRWSSSAGCFRRTRCTFRRTSSCVNCRTASR